VNASAAIVEAVATGELTPAAKLLTKDEARRIAPSKRRDLFIHCGVYLEDIGKPDEAAENPCETDIWYRCFSSGDIVWNFDQPSFWRCSLVRGEKPWTCTGTANTPRSQRVIRTPWLIAAFAT
jgi:hypothetical protein